VERKELEKLISEMVLEMLENKDEKLIAVIKEHDSKFDTNIPDTFIEETISLLKEHLGIKEEDKPLTPADVERDKMLRMLR